MTPYGLVELSLLGEDDPMMGAGGGIGERVIREEAAKELMFMMNQVVMTGTGGRAKLPDREVAGKTGTTQAARDAWFLGFSADYVAGVWMGYDDNSPLQGVTGGGLPAEIWREVMIRVHDGLESKPLPMMRGEQVASDRDIDPRPEPQPQPRQGRGETAVERILRDLLGGGNR